MGRISISTLSDGVTVSCGDTRIARASSALELHEDGYPPVLYIPRADVAMERLTKSERTSHCPHKGDASYFDFTDRSGGRVDGIAWSYETPIDAAAQIAGHLAFYADKCDVRRDGSP